MHEIITLQFGQRSNYLATHFWNTQESYFTYADTDQSLVDHDVHFAPGVGADGSETFTPRTVIYDLKGGFGSLRKINALYELENDHESASLWHGPTVIQRQPAIEPHAYQQSLEAGEAAAKLTPQSVRYWSDFNRVFYHPRSIVQLNDYELQSALMPFERWDVGEELFANLDREHDLLDRDLRPAAEAADHMQAIQLLTTVDDAWGGFAARYLDRLRDEYGKLTVWTWAIEDTDQNLPRDKKMLRMANTARCFAEVSPQSSIYVPLGLPPLSRLPPYVRLDAKSMWHVSALFSAAYESSTLPSRLKAVNGMRQQLDDISAGLNVNGNQNIVKIQMSLSKDSLSLQNGHTNGDRSRPRPSLAVEDSAEEVEALDMDFFPLETEPSRGRGINRSHTFGQEDGYRGEGFSEDDEDEHDGHQRARRRALGQTIRHQIRTPLSFPLVDSYPEIFSTLSPDETTVSIHTALSTDTTVSLRIKSLQGIVRRGIGLDEREALSNSLGELAEAYEEGWDSGSDDDDD